MLLKFSVLSIFYWCSTIKKRIIFPHYTLITHMYLPDHSKYSYIIIWPWLIFSSYFTKTMVMLELSHLVQYHSFFIPSKLKFWTNFKINLFSVFSDTWCSIYFLFAENCLLELSHMPQHRPNWSPLFLSSHSGSFTIFLEISFIILFHFGFQISCVPYSF